MPTGQPITQRLESNFPAQGTAGATSSTVLGEMQANGQVTSVALTPNATITGVATNNRVFSITNRGSAGSGNTVVASVTFAAGTNAPADDEFQLTITNPNVSENDVLSLDETVNGTGMTHSGGRMQVEVTRTS